MRWAGYVARVRDEKYEQSFVEKNIKEIDHGKDLSINGAIILTLIL
jgi:hypothetical protein